MSERLERLINLVIALRETRLPLTAAQIRREVAGYGQSDSEAFRRMFERDKAALRQMGVPIDVLPLDRFGEGTGYSIDPARYNLPELDLEPAELTALAVAVEMTGLADDAGSGLLKLAVDAGAPDAVRSHRTPAVEIRLDAPHRAVLMEAQTARQAVRFTYARLGEPAAARTVDPHALVHRRGHWYLVGRDHDRDAQRVFRLDRIVGTVRLTGDPGAFPPLDTAIDVQAVVPPAPAGSPETAEVAASPLVAWLVARSARGGGTPVQSRGSPMQSRGTPMQGGGAPSERGWLRFTLPVGDPDRFVSWALGLGPDVEILSPPQLRARIVERLSEAAR